MILNVDGIAFKNQPSACAGKTPQLMRWDHSCRSAAPTVHVDLAVLAKNLPGHGPHYAWILETPAWTDKLLAHVLKDRRFETIFTHNKIVTRVLAECEWAPASGIWIKTPRVCPKNKLCSMITSPKAMLPGHRARIEWARRLEKSLDLFGLDSRIETKEQGLCDYMFSVAIENAQSSGYFTEKILDCFATGTVPIYLGDPDIDQVFDPEGIIKLEYPFDMSTLTRDRYMSMLPAIQTNFRLALEYEIPEDYIVRKYFRPKQQKGSRPMNLEEAIKAGDLAAAEEFVKTIRGRVDAGAIERGLAALTLALAYYDKDMLAEAEMWALRSLQGNFRADALKLLGEIALDRMDYESAIGWYEAAGAVTHEPPVPMVAAEQGRLEELRRAAAERVRPVRFGDPDDDEHVLLVQTVAGSGRLDGVLKTLEHAGVARWRGPKIVVVDAGSATGLDLPMGWAASSVLKGEGQAKTFFRALRLAVDSGAKRLTLFEDDVELAENALDYLARAIPPSDAAVTVWWTRLPAPFRQGPPMFLTMDDCAFARNVAVSMSVETAKVILESDAVKNWTELHKGDMVYPEALPGAKAAIHFPGIVQHIGDASLVGETEVRRSTTFIGVDADALSLV